MRNWPARTQAELVVYGRATRRGPMCAFWLKGVYLLGSRRKLQKRLLLEAKEKAWGGEPVGDLEADLRGAC